MTEWLTGSGEIISFQEVLNRVVDHSLLNGAVSIGTDSQVRKDHCTFSTAICLYGGDGQSGGRFFILRENRPKGNLSTLIQRITAEVETSVNLGIKIQKIAPRVAIELHLDISSSDKKERTSRFSDMLVGYARGAGFACRIKPDSWAAASVADKYSK